ncbi:unnamed protein product, partial [Musa acuminata subsp. burmannicoides]
RPFFRLILQLNFRRTSWCYSRLDDDVKVIARTVGLRRLISLNFYPFLQKYVQPHQRDVTDLLAAAVQACYDMVVLFLL